MILRPLQFEWKVCENDGAVKFCVRQHPSHIIHERYYSRGKIPPIGERVKYYKALGASEQMLKAMIKSHKNAIKNSEKNQKVIDDIFAKFNVKPTKKKILKPVKKI
jgi:methionyl-tRNA synthetase